MRNLYKFVEGDEKKPVNLIQLKFVAAAGPGLGQGQPGRQNTWLYSQIQLA